jgi:Xaa-Pro aminopeptidase
LLTTIPDNEFKERVQRVQEKMLDEKLDIIITFGDEAEPQYVRYFSDYWPSFETAGVFIPLEGDPMLLIGPESLTYAKAWSRIESIKRLKEYRESSEPEYPGEVLTSFEELFTGVLKYGSFQRIGIAGYPLMPAPLYGSVMENAGRVSCEVVRAENLIIGMKQIKSENEIELMRNAAVISEKAFEGLLGLIEPGMTEIQVVGEAHKLIRQFGAEGEAYPLWCISGRNSDQAIARPSHKKIQKGELIQVQIGARLGGYASTIGRPLVLGKASKEIYDFIKIGLDAHEEVIGCLREGVEAKSVDSVYRNFLKKRNAESFMLYGPCHGTGMMEGEHPWIEKDSVFILKRNMTFCVDNFLKTDQYGLRWEDVVRIDTNGSEEFTTKYREVIVIN